MTRHNYFQRLHSTAILTFHRPTPTEQRAYELDETCVMFKHSNFDKQKATVLYIHGYVEAPSHQSVNVIVQAYLQRNDHNVLVLDWSPLADGNYLLDAVPNVKQVCDMRSGWILWFFG